MSEERITALLSEAAQWHLIGLLFEYPDDSWRCRLQALLPDLRQENLRAMGQAALSYATEGLHIALFGPAGSVPVREVTYQGGVQFGYLMAELSAYYEAFGYRPAIAEADDHLAVELGFVSYLRIKQALALASDDEDHAAVTAEAATSFLKDHLAMMAEPVAKALEIFAPDFLIDAGALVLEQTGPSPRSGYPLGANLCEEDDEIACGPSAASSDLVQLT